MLDTRTVAGHRPSPEMVARADVDAACFGEIYAAPIPDWEAFLGEKVTRIDRSSAPAKDRSFGHSESSIECFAYGRLNLSTNCVDSHPDTRGDRTAIIWRPDDPEDEGQHIAYTQLAEEVDRMSNGLENLGVDEGDCVVHHLPRRSETIYAMPTYARIGGIHSIFFAGVLPNAFGARTAGCDVKVIITADAARRGRRVTNLKNDVNQGLIRLTQKAPCLVVRRTDQQIASRDGLDHWLREAAQVDADLSAEPMVAEDPPFILYTSRSEGQPRSVVHVTDRHLTYAAVSGEIVFDDDGDLFRCIADVGWITGQTHIVNGPLANGATTLMLEGAPTIPDAGRLRAAYGKYEASRSCTDPTAIYALMGLGYEQVMKHDLPSLPITGTLTEPIYAEARVWYGETVGEGRCPIDDTWRQTDVGGLLMTPLPGAHETKCWSAQKLFFGVNPVVLDAMTGRPVEGNGVERVPCLDDGRPGQVRTVWEDHEYLEKTCFADYSGYDLAGDGCWRDEDDYASLVGTSVLADPSMVDDVIDNRMNRKDAQWTALRPRPVRRRSSSSWDLPARGKGRRRESCKSNSASFSFRPAIFSGRRYRRVRRPAMPRKP